MATWECKDCGYSKGSRCKPKKCPECGNGAFEKKEES